AMIAASKAASLMVPPSAPVRLVLLHGLRAAPAGKTWCYPVRSRLPPRAMSGEVLWEGGPCQGAVTAVPEGGWLAQGTFFCRKCLPRKAGSPAPSSWRRGALWRRGTAPSAHEQQAFAQARALIFGRHTVRARFTVPSPPAPSCRPAPHS